MAAVGQRTENHVPPIFGHCPNLGRERDPEEGDVCRWRRDAGTINAAGGTFQLAFEGYVTTPLAYNATAAQVDSALDALASVDNVTVTGNAGEPWTVTFGGSQANTNVSRMGGDTTAATTGTLVRTLSYTFDAASQLTAASDPDSSYAISYDNLGRVLTVDNNRPGLHQGWQQPVHSV